MNNLDKAKEIAVKWKAKGLPYNAIYDACLEMAQWKDEQFKKFLRETCFVSEKFISEKFDKINEL